MPSTWQNMPFVWQSLKQTNKNSPQYLQMAIQCFVVLPNKWTTQTMTLSVRTKYAIMLFSLSSATYLLLLISMLWHRQAIFESKGDKLSSSAESRIRTQGVSETQSSADWMPADKPTELSRIKQKNLNSTARPYDIWWRLPDVYLEWSSQTISFLKSLNCQPWS